MAVSLLFALPLAADAGWEAAVREIGALAQPLGFNWSKAQLLSSKASSRAAQPAVSYFLRSFDGSGSIPIFDEAVAARLEGVTNLRLLPGTFPEGMDYHFDGLAAGLCLTVANGSLTFRTTSFLSNAGRNYSACLFMGVGDSKPGPVPCFQNPAVNLLPIANQLWLTVDTSSWDLRLPAARRPRRVRRGVPAAAGRGDGGRARGALPARALLRFVRARKGQGTTAVRIRGVRE